MELASLFLEQCTIAKLGEIILQQTIRLPEVVFFIHAHVHCTKKMNHTIDCINLTDFQHSFPAE